jgi:hypothetical protein
MRPFSHKPRVAALIMALIGFVLVAVNHQTVLKERHYYPMLMLFGPVCILIGIAGAIAPGLLNQSGIQTGHSTALSRLVTLALVLIGLAIGWSMAHFGYGIW